MSINEEEIRQRVERWIKKRNEFFIHLTSFITTNIFIWGIYFAIGGGFPWPMFVTGGWAIGLVAHWADMRGHSPNRIVDRERMVQRLVDREKARLGISSDATEDYEKPKRKQSPASSVTLSDDGELVSEDENFSTQPRQQRKQG